MLNSDLLTDLIKQAQGDRSLNEFAKQCGIDSGNLSKIINKKNKHAPKPETLNKIATHAQNDVTYEQLLDAAGHIKIETTTVPIQTPVLTEKDEKDIAKQVEKLTKTLMENSEGLMYSGEPLSPEAVQSILDNLIIGIRLAKLRNKKYIPKKYRDK
jgi:HTH-type transcriptional regulator, competence development regulator